MGKKKGDKSMVKMKTPLAPPEEPEELSKAPHSFVIHRGSVGKHIMQLMKDFRKVMEPYTASSLKVRKKNSIKDFVSISGLLHVSHMSMFTITETSPYMRIARLPQGPTLTFKIHNYSLARDVVSSLRRQYSHSKSFLNSPLVILNGFSTDNDTPHIKLMSTMFQSMFPTLNVTKLNLNNMKRCVLLNYNAENKCIEFRHYVIRVTPTGLNRGVKKLVLGKVPNLSKYSDVSDFISKDELLSDMSEAEDEGSHVVIPQKMSSKGNYANNTSAIRLTELGPRLTLQLVKVEGGLMDGEVMFHEFVHKSEEEIEEIKKQRRIKRRLKEIRRREQEMNVKRKEEEMERHKELCLEGMERKKKNEQMEVTESRTGVEEEEVEGPESSRMVQDDEDDDAEWYRKEVGQEPEPELFSKWSGGGKRGRGGGSYRGNPFKKGRFSMKGKYGDRGGTSRGRGNSRPRMGTGRGRFQTGRGGFRRATDNYGDNPHNNRLNFNRNNSNHSQRRNN